MSFDLLMPVEVYTAQSSKCTWALYYDGSIGYFSKQHLPYAILALLFVLFGIIPVATLLSSDGYVQQNKHNKECCIYVCLVSHVLPVRLHFN